jgi:ATP-dependent Lon protease
LFNALVFNQVANPIVMMDEIDKVRGDKSYNPLAALHQLLELRQAKRFRDLSVPELNVDASHVIWIATANTLDNIDKPIIDRFTVFPIADPSRTQMSAIVTNQYQRFIDTHPCGKIFEGNRILPEVLDELCKHHPRKVRKMLDQAFGLAAIHKRSYLTVDDIKACDSGDKRKTGIGFMSDDSYS